MPFPLTMDVQDDRDGTGTSIWTVDVSAVVAGEKPSTTWVNFTRQGETLTFTLKLQEGSAALTGVATVSTKNGELVMEGTIDAPGAGKAVFLVTKQR
jgi:hypothetical protein